MPVVETYASRVADGEKAGTPDVYTYDELPSFLRKQISQIFTECIGPAWDLVNFQRANKFWEEIARRMDREIETFNLGVAEQGRAYLHCMEYLRRSNHISG